MSQFYAEIQGGRGIASRQGHKNSGIWGHIRGWHSGVHVSGHFDEEGEQDVFNVSVTSGSGFRGVHKYIGCVKLNEDGEPTWYPAE